MGTAWELDEHVGNSKIEIPEAIPKSNSIVIDVNLGPCWVRETKTTPNEPTRTKNWTTLVTTTKELY